MPANYLNWSAIAENLEQASVPRPTRRVLDQPEGNLHAYLNGSGIELMGASDNVVRAGLTTKPVDVETLLEVMDPTPLLDPVMSEGTEYLLEGTSIRLLRLVGPASRRAKSHELVVMIPGRTGYLAPGEQLDVAPGETAFVATA